MRTGPGSWSRPGQDRDHEHRIGPLGYVGTRYVFAILQNGSPIAWVNARRSRTALHRRSPGPSDVAERFTTTIELQGKTATFFAVPLDVRAVFGRARLPVRVTIGGHTYRSTIAVYGDRYFLPLNRANRSGRRRGRHVEVEVEADDDLRTVDVPAELQEALEADANARTAFDALSFTHRREYVEWVAEAKRDDTKLRRAAKAVGDLRAGKTR